MNFELQLKLAKMSIPANKSNIMVFISIGLLVAIVDNQAVSFIHRCIASYIYVVSYWFLLDNAGRLVKAQIQRDLQLLRGEVEREKEKEKAEKEGFNNGHYFNYKDF